MRVFRELFIRGEPNQLAATARAICDAMSGHWSRDAEVEERGGRNALPDQDHVYSFKCEMPGLRSAVNLFLMDSDPTTLEVTNIVPRAAGPLTIDEYNGVMEEFTEQFARPAADRTGARVELTDADADLERWVSPETAHKLRRFCRTANKWSGSTHPSDRELWYDFLLAAYREGADLDPDTLARWLREGGGWDEEWADRLAAEYGFARGLLTSARAEPAGV